MTDAQDDLADLDIPECEAFEHAGALPRRPARKRPGFGAELREQHETMATKLERLRAEAASCRACPLWKPATQTVFGQGPASARAMIVGETPGDREWLEREIELARPAGLLAMGATAAGALLGSSVRVTKDRGQLIESDLAAAVMVTIHPSAILRARGDVERHELRDAFAADVRAFAAVLSGQS
jgi:uracil-DNA glycosylase